MMYNVLDSRRKPAPRKALKSGDDNLTWQGSGFYGQYGKRMVDVVGALVLLLVFSPLILVIAAMQLTQSGGVFFSHGRIGRSGETFGCLKFRTMAPDADRRLQDLLNIDPDARREWEETHKLTDDPRITGIGHVLRRSSMDELPQLLNVLKGEMSLVGPRPVTEAELAKYGDRRCSYLLMRPGLTGPWQVGGRNDVSYDHRVRLDDEYAKTFSLTGDLAILGQTVGVVLGATGR